MLVCLAKCQKGDRQVLHIMGLRAREIVSNRLSHQEPMETPIGNHPSKRARYRWELATVTNTQFDSLAPSSVSTRSFVMREWPYLAMLILALFGVAYASVTQRPMTLYWLALAPFIGIFCVITRWRDVQSREMRLRLIWTQALHWGAVLAAMNSDLRGGCGPDDERRCQGPFAAYASRSGDLHRRCSCCGVAHLPGGSLAGSRGPSDRVARATGAASPACGCCSACSHRAVLVAARKACRQARKARHALNTRNETFGGTQREPRRA